MLGFVRGVLAATAVLCSATAVFGQETVKVGAVQEAVLRKSFLCNGEYLDQVLWAIVEDDWRAQQQVEREVSTFRQTIH